MKDDDYEVGYRKPPAHTRFKPGQSGNPKGRPKGVKNLSTDLEEELEQTITVSEGGHTHKVTKQRAMIKTMVTKAMKGDPRAAQVIVNLVRAIEEARTVRDEAERPDPNDEVILNRFRQMVLDEASTQPSEEETSDGRKSNR